MNMVGDMGRYTQYQVAQSIPIAAANEGGGAAGVGAGLGAGVAMGQAMMDALKKAGPVQWRIWSRACGGRDNSERSRTDTKFCINCGKPIPKISRFCSECGHAQQ